MTDLFGDDFSDLLSSYGDRAALAKNASSLFEMTQGSIFLWPKELIAASDDMEELKFRSKVMLEAITSFKRLKSRAGDPLLSFVELLLKPENTKKSTYGTVYITRKKITDHLLQSKAILDPAEHQIRNISSRIQNDLQTYNLITLLIPHKGRSPAVYKINYPFDLIEPAIQKPTAPEAEIDLRNIVPLSDEDYEGQIIDMRRIIFHKGRPHEHIDEEGRVLDKYKRETIVYEPETGAKKLVSLISESHSAVMTKKDESVWTYVVNWCLHQIKERFKYSDEIDPLFILTPEIVLEMMGASGRANLNQVSEMMVRWKDTRITAEEVQHLKGDLGDGEFINWITEETGVQFAEAKLAWTTMKNGTRKLRAVAFTLPANLQKELERRAKFDKESEEKIGNLAKYLTASGNRSLLNDSFALAVDNFFWRIAKRYSRTPNGWKKELWTGLAEMFDFTFYSPPEGMDPVKKRSKIDSNKKLFLRNLKRFIYGFSKTPERDYDVFMGYKGGTINIEVIRFNVTIELMPRKKSSTQKGTVSIKPTSKLLISSNESKPDEIEDIKIRLLNFGISKSATTRITNENSLSVIEKAIELTQLMTNYGLITKNPSGFFVSLFRDGCTEDMLDSNIESIKHIASRPLSDKEKRRKITKSVLDVNDLDW